MKYSIIQFFSLPLLLSVTAHASQQFLIAHGSSVQTSVLVQAENGKLSPKAIQVDHYQFTDKQKSMLIKRLLTNNTSYIQGSMNQQAQLGMNNVPVLDQGGFGSCVTFANTAAMDAIIGKGDYISQLCNLTLGQYFENNAQNYPSGWSGSFGPIVLTQMTEFGIIPKAQEQEVNCGGALSYGAVVHTQPIELNVFKKYSQPVGQYIWQPILTLLDSLYFNKDMSLTLSEVKASILSGDRVTVGFLLDISFPVGIAGQYRKANDTWVMTPQIEEHLRAGRIEEGHEVIITGFDDNAQVKDRDGNYHQGVLTIRNSWGSYAGDYGDYYMTYDYFLLMVIEAQRIMDVNI